MSAIIRAGVHADGRALVYCGGGCGETLRQGEHEIMARENLGMGAPVCPWCRTAGTLEHLAAAALKKSEFSEVKITEAVYARKQISERLDGKGPIYWRSERGRDWDGPYTLYVGVVMTSPPEGAEVKVYDKFIENTP